MRILQIINSLGTGGAEKLLLDIVPKYNKLGYTVDVLILWNNNHQFTEALKAMNCCKVMVLNESDNVKDIYKLGNINSIKKILPQYDIAHIHLFPAQHFTILAKLLSKAPLKLIFTEHNTTNTRLKIKALTPLEKWFYKKLDRLVCITEEIKDIYKKYLGFDESYYEVIFNGVDLEKIKTAKPYQPSEIHASLNNDDIILTQIAAFRPQKDQKTLIKALEILPPHYKLLLVGDGDTRAENEQLAITLGLQHRVFFLGQRMDVPALLKSSDVVVLSSHYEGLSLSSIEGLASGVPFIASNVPGLSEIVGGYGLLFDQGDYKKLAELIIQVTTQKELNATITAKCQERAEAFNIDIMVDAHIKLYNNVFNS